MSLNISKDIFEIEPKTVNNKKGFILYLNNNYNIWDSMDNMIKLGFNEIDLIALSENIKYKIKNNNILTDNNKDFELLSDEIYGDFNNNDKAKRIVDMIIDNNILYYLVEWEPRDNNYKPQNSIQNNYQLKKNNINLLLDYYESNLKICNN